MECSSLYIQACRKQQLILRREARIFLPADTRITGLSTGLSAMSSILGVVAKQLKSHPAVSPEPCVFFLTCEPPGDIEGAAEDARGEARARSPKSHLHQAYLMRDHQLFLFIIYSYGCPQLMRRL